MGDGVKLTSLEVMGSMLSGAQRSARRSHIYFVVDTREVPERRVKCGGFCAINALLILLRVLV
jgi:hypothetical protein